MNIAPLVIFAGPTLQPGDVELDIEALWLPPVSQGDVFGLVRFAPRAIAIVDGYFERVPAVWHKEILWAMSNGIHVFGAASMGALRASELHNFGMVGVGKIFEDFHHGKLTDDDEVAILHGPAEAGYPQLSEAMVDIRATLAAAHTQGILDDAVHDDLIGLVKAEFYPDRNYRRLLELAAGHPRLSGAVPKLADFLERGKVRQKHEDAVLLLRTIAELWPTLAEPKEVAYFFQATDAFMELQKQGQRAPPPAKTRAAQEGPGVGVLDATSHLPDAVLEELKLRGESYRLARLRSRCRLFGQTAAEVLRLKTHPQRIEQVLAEHTEKVETSGKSLEDWLGRQELSRPELKRLLEKRLAVAQLEAELEILLDEAVREDLKIEGLYGELAEFCREKWQLLADYGWLSPTLADAGLTEVELWSWHFARLGITPPADLGAYAREMGCSSPLVLREAVLRDYLFKSGRRQGT